MVVAAIATTICMANTATGAVAGVHRVGLRAVPVHTRAIIPAGTGAATTIAATALDAGRKARPGIPSRMDKPRVILAGQLSATQMAVIVPGWKKAAPRGSVPIAILPVNRADIAAIQRRGALIHHLALRRRHRVRGRDRIVRRVRAPRADTAARRTVPAARLPLRNAGMSRRKGMRPEAMFRRLPKASKSARANTQL